MREISQVHSIGWLGGVRRSGGVAAAPRSESTRHETADAVSLSLPTAEARPPASRALNLARRMAGVGTLIGLSMIGSLAGVVSLEASTSAPAPMPQSSISVPMERKA